MINIFNWRVDAIIILLYLFAVAVLVGLGITLILAIQWAIPLTINAIKGIFI